MMTYYRLRIHCPDGATAEKEYRDKETATADWKAVTFTGLINAVVEEFTESDDYEIGDSLYMHNN